MRAGARVPVVAPWHLLLAVVAEAGEAAIQLPGLVLVAPRDRKSVV